MRDYWIKGVFWSLAAMIWLSTLPGCSPLLTAPQHVGADKKAVAPYDRESVQRDLMNVVDDLITSAADQYGKAIQSAKSKEMIEFAENQRLEIASGALDNAVDANPLAGLMDTVVLISLSRSAAELPASREALGESFEPIVAMLKRHEEIVWLVAARYLSAAQVTELRQAIDAWREKNPEQRYVSHVRLVDFLNTIPKSGESVQQAGSIFSLLFLDPLAGLDPAVREMAQSRDVAERMFFYGQRISLILSWRAEMTYRRALAADEIAAWRKEVEEFNKSTRSVSETLSRFVATVEKLPESNNQLVKEFFKSLDGASEKIVREAATQVSAERAAALTQAAREVSEERDKAIVQATTRIAVEREAAVTQISNDLRLRQQETVKDVESAAKRASDNFAGGLLSTALISIAVFFAALIFYQLLMLMIRRNQKGEPAVSHGENR